MKEIQHISALSLYVHDMDKSREFYTRVFDAPIQTLNNNNFVVRLDNFFLNILHESLAYEPYSPQHGARALEINIWVEEVDTVYQTLLNRGVAFLSPPQNQPWGMRNITFFDPDGHRFEIASHIPA